MCLGFGSGLERLNYIRVLFTDSEVIGSDRCSSVGWRRDRNFQILDRNRLTGSATGGQGPRGYVYRSRFEQCLFELNGLDLSRKFGNGNECNKGK